jgi:hypothetical protein
MRQGGVKPAKRHCKQFVTPSNQAGLPRVCCVNPLIITMKIHAITTAVALLCSVFLQAQAPESAPKQPAGLHGPVTHKNLQIFLIKGEDRLTEVKVKVLDEAMKDKTAVVRETGNVSKLSIENNDKGGYVFVQSGDIVKGGRQDRTLPNDILVKAGSGKLPIDAFCVEQGRWQQRGQESATAFNGSTKTLSNSTLKYAAKVEKSQGKVWEKIAKEQQKLSSNVYKGAAKPEASPPPAATNTSNDAINTNDQGTIQTSGTNATTSSVADARSASSLQLALENKELEKLTKEYVDAVQGAPEQVPGSIGFAYAVNGLMVGAEMYANGTLFRKLWPKLLESVVHEAIAEQKEGIDGAPLSQDAAQNWLGATETAKVERQEYPAGNATLKRDAKESVRFDTLVPAKKGKAKETDWIHRSILRKEAAEQPQSPK